MPGSLTKSHGRADNCYEAIPYSISSMNGALPVDSGSICLKVGLSGTHPSEVSITRSVLASLREYPGYVEALFRTTSTNEAGKYSVQLFDMWQRKWRYINVTWLHPYHTHSPYHLMILHDTLRYIMISRDASWHPWACNPHGSSWYIKVAPDTEGTFHDASFFPHDSCVIVAHGCVVIHLMMRFTILSRQVDDFMPVQTFPKEQSRHWAGGAFYPLWVTCQQGGRSVGAFVETELPVIMRWCCWKRRAWAGIYIYVWYYVYNIYMILVHM